MCHAFVYTYRRTSITLGSVGFSFFAAPRASYFTLLNAIRVVPFCPRCGVNRVPYRLITSRSNTLPSFPFLPSNILFGCFNSQCDLFDRSTTIQVVVYKRGFSRRFSTYRFWKYARTVRVCNVCHTRQKRLRSYFSDFTKTISWHCIPVYRSTEKYTKHFNDTKRILNLFHSNANRSKRNAPLKQA